MLRSIMITGANSGLGKEAARQFALRPEVERIVLACRDESRAAEAQLWLEESTGRSIFEVLIVDVSDPDSARAAVDRMQEPVDALVLNAGGMGGQKPLGITSQGVTNMFAANMLGHSILTEEMIRRGLIKQAVLYAGSEAARGVKKMNIKRPALKTFSSEEFTQVINGTYDGKLDDMANYGLVKLMASLWMSTMARKHQDLQFVTMSPGGTSGTKVMDKLPMGMKLMFKYVMMPIMMPLMGMVHGVEVGAKRYVDGLTDPAYLSGHFYASKESTVTGPIIDQGDIFPLLYDVRVQDNAWKAIHAFHPKVEAAVFA
ncbi:MAG: SDR family NAD(P)-dependent oxidoreductase [Flavobacteriales bacterium]|nr:SDR family NAD(P)-dependent oxidoreductase [Flavobacteriales bacterium]